MTLVSPDENINLRALCGGSDTADFSLAAVTCRDDDPSDSGDEERSELFLPREHAPKKFEASPFSHVEVSKNEVFIIDGESQDDARSFTEPVGRKRRNNYDEENDYSAPPPMVFDHEEEEEDEAYRRPADSRSKRRRILDEEDEEDSVVDLCSSGDDEESNDIEEDSVEKTQKPKEVFVLEDSSSDDSVIDMTREYTAEIQEECLDSIVEIEDDDDFINKPNDSHEDLLHPEFRDTFRSVEWLKATNTSRIHFDDLLVDSLSLDAGLRRLAEARRKRQAGEGGAKQKKKKTATRTKKKTTTTKKKGRFQAPQRPPSASSHQSSGMSSTSNTSRTALATTTNLRPPPIISRSTGNGGKARAKSTFDKKAYRRANPLPKSI